MTAESSQAQRDWCQRLFAAHPDPQFVMDPTGRFIDANAAFEQLTGYSCAELKALTYAPFVHPDDAQRVADEFTAALAGATRDYEARGLDRSGADFRVHVTNVAVVDDRGTIVGVLGIARDISERLAQEAALATSEQRFRGLFEGAGAGIAITDLRGRFVDANPAYLAMSGYTLEQLRTTGLLSLTHPDDRGPKRERLDALVTGEVPSFTLEKRSLTAGGQIVWVRASVSLIRDADGRPLHIAATAEDITTQREAQRRLRRSERLRGLAGELALVGGWSIEASDQTVYWSPEIFRILDVPDGEEPPLVDAVGMYPEEYRERLEAAIGACLSHGTPFDLEMEVRTHAGRRIPVRAIAEAERDEEGQVVRVTGAFQDITDLRRATVEAREAVERLTTTLESMTDAFFTVDRDWRFTFLNSRAEQLLRRTRDDLLGKVIWEEFPEAVDGPLYELYHRAVNGGGTQVIEEFYYEPLDLWLDVNAYPSDQGLAVYFRDVAEAHHARVALEERESILRRQADLLDAAQDAILVRDLEHRIVFWNRSAERIYGWGGDEALGANIRELLYEDPIAFDAATAAVFADGAWTGDLVQRTRAGDRVVVSGRWTLVRDRTGQPEAILAINTDITEQQRIEQQLLRAQRLESIGTLAGGVAHDLNNMLSPILLATELLQLRGPDPEESDLLDTIATSARRGSDLVTQVLSFARGVEGQRAPVDLARLLTDIESIVRDTFPKNISFERRAPGQIRYILGDSTQIQQVLLNLAVNARDAMPEGGRLTITASEVVLDDQYVAATPGTIPGDYVRIEVEDNGTGMSPDVRDRVFEPFFTTKPQGSGTGLGLSTSAAIVKSHGGFLRVYSEPGRGSQFRLYLPTGEEECGDSRSPAQADHPRGAGQTVLIVDDEAAVRAMTRQTLETYGYHVLEAGNGAEAVSQFAQHRDEVDIVLTDMMMPIMDGPAAIHALRDIDPGLRIVGASGLHGNGKVAQAAAAGVTRFIPKPYTSQALLEILHEALDGAP